MSTKTCVKCGVEKDINNFYSRKDKRNNKVVVRFNSYCKTCSSKYDKDKRKDYYKQYNKDYYIKNADKNRKTSKEYAREIRKNCIGLYGGKCAFCENSDFEVLTIDHIELGGRKHRKEAGGCIPMYKDIITNYNPNLYRVLCYNCNCGKRTYEAKERNRKEQIDYNYRKRKRFKVLSMYGSCCANCGIDDFEVLTIDHKNSDGSLDRKSHGSGTGFVSYLSKIPKRDDLELLCWNCNCKKAKREQGSRISQKRAAVT